MDEIVKGVFTAPVATLFIVSGMIFLLIAVIGNISGRIEPGFKARIISGVFGLAFILIGISMHMLQGRPNIPTSPTASSISTKPDQPTTTLQTITPPSGTEASGDLQASDAVPQPKTAVASTSTNGKIPALWHLAER